MPDSDLNASKHAAPPARLRPGRILLYAVLMFFAMVAASVIWRLLCGEPELDAAQSAPPTQTAAVTQPATDSDLAAQSAPSSTAPTPNLAIDTRTAAELAPASLQGSEVDGGISLVNGRIQANLDLRRMFDYFLTALGEMDVAQIRTWLAAHVRERYGESVLAEALSLFDRYVELGQASATADLASLDHRERLAVLKALRQKLLGPDVARAFYADEEAYLEYSLDRMALQQDTSLSAAEREQALADLEATLPAAIRDSIHHATLGVVAEEQTRELDARGADAATRQAEREALVGKEAADRLAALDQQRALWDQRVADYKTAHARIQATPGLSAEARRQQVEQLLSQRFNAEERARVEALQAIGAL